MRTGGVLFRNSCGAPLTRDGVVYVLSKHFRRAAEHVPALRKRRITPHVMGHSCPALDPPHLAPKGETPVLIHSFNRKKLSGCAALGFSWNGRRSGLYFQTPAGSYNSESLMAFLEDLKRERRGQKVILVGDGLPAHKSKVMKNTHSSNDAGSTLSPCWDTLAT